MLNTTNLTKALDRFAAKYNADAVVASLNISAEVKLKDIGGIPEYHLILNNERFLSSMNILKLAGIAKRNDAEWYMTTDNNAINIIFF